MYFERCARSNQKRIKIITQRNLTKKIVSRAMRREAEQKMKYLHNKPNNVFKLVNFFLKIEGQDINGG